MHKTHFAQESTVKYNELNGGFEKNKLSNKNKKHMLILYRNREIIFLCHFSL